MSPAHRWYLVVEQGVGAAIFNFALNAAIAWLLFRSRDVVPLWGDRSIAGDTIATSMILPFLTTLIVTPTARRQVRAGRVVSLGWSRATHPTLGWLPRGTLARAFVLGIVCALVLSPLTLLVLAVLHVAHLGLGRFVVFKASLAAFEALLVTPVVSLWAIAEAPGTRPAARAAS